LNYIASLFASALTAVAKKPDGSTNFRAAFRSIVRHPIKVIASFFFAPFLAIQVARTAKNPVRRAIAIAGMLLGTLLAWIAGTFLGSVIGAIFMASNFGPLVGLGFLFGTTFSFVFSVTFMILTFNATTWLFLHMSSDEVIAYLNSLSKDHTKGPNP
jgi:hypothetical protein